MGDITTLSHWEIISNLDRNNIHERHESGLVGTYNIYAVPNINWASKITVLHSIKSENNRIKALEYLQAERLNLSARRFIKERYSMEHQRTNARAKRFALKYFGTPHLTMSRENETKVRLPSLTYDKSRQIEVRRAL